SFRATASTLLSSLSLHDALPILSYSPSTSKQINSLNLVSSVISSSTSIVNSLFPKSVSDISFIDTGLSSNVKAHLLGASIILSRSEEHTSELQSRFDLVCRLLLE